MKFYFIFLQCRTIQKLLLIQAKRNLGTSLLSKTSITWHDKDYSLFDWFGKSSEVIWKWTLISKGRSKQETFLERRLVSRPLWLTPQLKQIRKLHLQKRWISEWPVKRSLSTIYPFRKTKYSTYLSNWHTSCYVVKKCDVLYEFPLKFQINWSEKCLDSSVRNGNQSLVSEGSSKELNLFCLKIFHEMCDEMWNEKEYIV